MSTTHCSYPLSQNTELGDGEDKGGRWRTWNSVDTTLSLPWQSKSQFQSLAINGIHLLAVEACMSCCLNCSSFRSEEITGEHRKMNRESILILTPDICARRSNSLAFHCGFIWCVSYAHSVFKKHIEAQELSAQRIEDSLYLWKPACSTSFQQCPSTAFPPVSMGEPLVCFTLQRKK